MSFEAAFYGLFLSYLWVTALYLIRLVWAKPLVAAIALRWCLITALVHSFLLARYFLEVGVQDLGFSFEAFQISANLVAWIFVGLCFYKKFYAAGPLFVALIDLFFILSFEPKAASMALVQNPSSPFLFFHLSGIFLSLTFFMVGFISAILFLIADYQIKQKKLFSALARLPSLSEIEAVHFESMKLGFMLFTGAILMGAGYAKIETGFYVSSDFKQVLSYVTWIFFAILLNWREKLGWRGHKGIMLSLAGFFGLLCLAFVGLK